MAGKKSDIFYLPFFCQFLSVFGIRVSDFSCVPHSYRYNLTFSIRNLSGLENVLLVNGGSLA